eukprot:jgi/Bigna1/137306/aug1.38_g12014
MEGKFLEMRSDLNPAVAMRPRISSLPDLLGDNNIMRRISSIAGAGVSRGGADSKDNIRINVNAAAAAAADDGSAAILISPPPAEEDTMQRAFFSKGSEGKTGGGADVPRLFELSDGALGNSMIDDDDDDHGGYYGIDDAYYGAAGDLISPMAKDA